jgi:hypothetical protein
MRIMADETNEAAKRIGLAALLCVEYYKCEFKKFGFQHREGWMK